MFQNPWHGSTPNYSSEYYTGNILVVKYKAAAGSTVHVFAGASVCPDHSVIHTDAQGHHDAKYNVALEAATDWAYYVVDLTTLFGAVFQPETINGETYYSMNYMRIDFSGEVEIEYIAILDNADYAAALGQ